MFWESCDPQLDAKPCLIDGATVWTYQEVFAAADALYEAQEPGVVALLCDRTVDTVVAYLGALRKGCVPLLLDAGLRPEALARALDAYTPDFVFAAESALPGNWDVVRGFGDGTLFAAKGGQSRPPLHPDLTLLLPTSGSTGDPKCVRLSARNIQSCTDDICRYLAMTSDRRAISLLPLHYSYGLSVLHSVLNSRASFVVTRLTVLDRDFWTLMEEAGVTDFSAVPFIFETIRRMRLSEGVLNTLQCVTQAGGRLDPRFTRHFSEIFAAAGIRYFTMYGQTEASPRISYLPPEAAAEKLGSVGVPLSCGEVMLAETGAASGEGELVYKGPNVCMGYARCRADLSAGDDLNGVLHTGDQARIDEDGYIFIVGRRKRFIKLQGTSVNLDYVETVLKSRDIECIVVGRENRILICHMQADDAVLARVMADNFTFHPSSGRYKNLPELPLNASGKPDYALVSEEYL